MTREPGFYWVKPNANDPWEVARYNHGSWEPVGYGPGAQDEDYDVIDERRITRDPE